MVELLESRPWEQYTSFMSLRSPSRNIARILASFVGATGLVILSTSGVNAQQYPPASVPPISVPPVVVPPAVVPASIATATTVVATVAPAAPASLKAEVLGNQVSDPPAAPAIQKSEVASVAALEIGAPAYTGSNASSLTVAGVALFGAGAALVVLSRRRRSAR